MTTTPHGTRARTLLTGLLALTGLVAIIAGVPWLLTHLAGNPFASVPTWGQITGALSRPDDGTLLVTLFTIAAWIGWAGFTVSVLTQLVLQLSRVRAPRFTGLIAPSLAGRMVAAVLALGALSTVGLASATAANATTTTVTSSTTTPADAASDVTTTPATITVTQQVPTQVTVEAGDTLWGIAEDEYGQGQDWPRIYEANQGAPQAGGVLDDPDLIQPGLTVTIPGKSTTIEVTVPAPAGDSAESPSPHHSTSSTENGAQGPAGASTPQSAETATTAPQGPSTASQAPVTPSPTLAATGQAPAEATTADASVVRTVAGLGSIAAAGVLAMLLTRRRRQARTRRPGQRLNLPTGAAAIAEAQLRVAADPITVDDLDHLLRHLAEQAAPHALPPLRAARITTSDIELYLAHDHDTLPAPAAPLPDQAGTWLVSRADIPHHVDPDTPAPYPTLVTLGQDEDEAHLLVNLEEIRSLAIDGPASRDVLTALTLELIAAGWGDEVTVTLVDLLPELADAVRSDRVTYVDHLEQILNGIEYAAGVHSTVMTSVGADNPTQARAAGAHPETWTPHLILTAAAPTTAETERLAELLIAYPHLSLAAVTLGDPLTGWQLTAHDPTRATLTPAGIELTPQLLAPADLDALLDAFRAADGDMHDGPAWADTLHGEPDLVDLPDPTDVTSAPAWLLNPDLDDEYAAATDGDISAEPVEEAPHQEDLEASAPTLPVDPIPAVVDVANSSTNEKDPEELDQDPETEVEAEVEAEAVDDQPDPVGEAPEETAPASTSLTRAPADLLPTDRPVLRLLGPVRVDNAPGPRPRAVGTALKILTHLALAPGGHAEDLDQAVWPGQTKKATTRDAPIYTARTWLGNAPDGHPYLAYYTPDGGYRLADDMPDDWNLFQSLIGTSIGHTPLQDLTRALHLVTGKPLTGPRIAETAAETEMIAAIADVAHEVATRALTGGDHQLAAWAAAKGLDVEPVDEALWRDLFRAIHLTGDRDKLTAEIARYRCLNDDDGSDYDEDTSALIADLTRPATV